MGVYAFTEKYCIPGLSTGANDGTSETDAWQTLATAASNYSAGDRVNIKNVTSGTRHTLPADVDFAVDATSGTPIHIRGYTSTIGDGGMFLLDQPSTRAFKVSGYGTLVENIDSTLANRFTNFAIKSKGSIANNIKLDGGASAFVTLYNSVIEGEVSNNGKMIDFSDDKGTIQGCFVRAKYQNETGGRLIACTFTLNMIGNVIIGDGVNKGVTISQTQFIDTSCDIHYNIFYDCNDAVVLDDGNPVNAYTIFLVRRNVIYKMIGDAVKLDSTGTNGSEGFATLHLDGNAMGDLGGQRFNASNTFPELQPITLTADPFVDAANNDFTYNDTTGGGALLDSEEDFGTMVQRPWALWKEQQAASGTTVPPMGLGIRSNA